MDRRCNPFRAPDGERLRILHAWADPPSALATGTAVESGSLSTCLAPFSDWVDYRSQPACSRGDLLRRLNHFRPHVVHLSGHGAPDGSVVLMHPDTGAASPLTKRDLSVLLRGRPYLQLVVLTCCFGLVGVEQLADAVPAVVGVKASLEEPYPIVFAAALYDSLAHGQSVVHAVESAVVEAEERLAPGAGRFELWTSGRAQVESTTLPPSPAALPRTPLHASRLRIAAPRRPR